MDGNIEAIRYRTLFLSDFHLGMRAAQADLLLDFLRFHDADTIYLIGDIVDGWRLRRAWYWPQSHNDVVQKLLRKARKGTRVIYIPGNHDEMLRQYCGHSFGAVELKKNDIYELADGRKFLIIHGDEFDVVVRHAKWLALFGDWAYRITIMLNAQVNRVRRHLGFQYWSLSAWLKQKVKNAVNYIGEFESALSSEARRRGADGVICGHIHHPSDMMMDSGVRYVNTGDWVESCTAVVEHHDGRLEIIRWTDQVAALERNGTVPSKVAEAA
ncbi:MAG: UDP-2,3-diacylglucosamine diphosphatase [Rhodobiaceae bacterium]|nr:UDP-2,3-diacylglucosamine diphosphatase [Rhodobiaceae bacterium]